MNRLRVSTRLLLAGTSLLAILAACDVNDSPQHTDAPVSASFAPRILAPAGGFRQADWLVLDVWKLNATGGWDSIFHKDSIAPNKPSVDVAVPLSVKLKYRVAGYVSTFVNSVPRTDTVWSAIDSNFIVYNATPLSRPVATTARNWAIPVSAPAAASAVFTPGNAVTIKAGANQTIVVGTSANLSCTGATDTAVVLTALLQSPLQAWVLACGEDAAIHPSAPQLFSWTVDTIGTGALHTPTPPVPTGATGFVSGQLLTTAQLQPTLAVPFTGSTGLNLAWNLKVDGNPYLAPDSSEFAPAPATLAGSDQHTTAGTLDAWTVAKDSLSSYPLGMRLLVTAVRIDTALGTEWVSSPIRFWYSVVPPAMTARFSLVESGWDSVSVNWDLSDANLAYAAWVAIGDSTLDTSRSTRIPAASLALGSFGLADLPADTSITIIRTAKDPSTGLASLARSTVRTRALPALPTPFLIWPTSNGAQIKKSRETDIQAGSLPDSAGRVLKYRYAYSSKATSLVTDPALETWPDLAIAASALADASGRLSIDVPAGNFVFLTLASEDSAGRLSIPRYLHIQIADDAVVLPPDAPSGLVLTARTDSSLTYRWNSVASCRYRFRSTRTSGTVEDDISDTVFTISGLAAGELVADIAVKAINDTNASLFSPYTDPSLTQRSKSPPALPSVSSKGWETKTLKTVATWTWGRQAGAVDEFALVGVSDSLMVPGSIGWTPRPVTALAGDTVELAYANRPAGAKFIAFAVRTTRDSITRQSSWMWIPVPPLAPSLDPTNVRLWQFGNLWKVRLQNFPIPAGFKLAIHVKSSSLDRTFEFPTDTADLDLTPFGSGQASFDIALRRAAPLGIDAFDLGAAASLTKVILPPPSGFDLYPSATKDGEWIFTAPTDLISGARALFVRPSQTPPVSLPIATGETVFLDPDLGEKVHIAQLLNGDTSGLSVGRAVGRMSSVPTLKVVDGSYLIPFTVPVSGVAPQTLVNGTWTPISGDLDPSKFDGGKIILRDVDHFAVSATITRQIAFDSTFDDPIWGDRLKAGGATLPGADWLGSSKATLEWKGVDATGPSYLGATQISTLTPALVGFATTYRGGTPLDLNAFAGAKVGVTGSNSKYTYHLVVGSTSSRYPNPIFIPLSIASSGLNLLADFKPSGTILPFTFGTDGVTSLTLTTSELQEALKTVAWVGVQVRGPATVPAGVQITSFNLVSDLRPYQ